MELNNRALAGVFWFGVLVVLASLIPSWRSAIWPAVAGLFRAFKNWKVWLPLLLYLAYVMGVVHLARRLGWWNATCL